MLSEGRLFTTSKAPYLWEISLCWALKRMLPKEALLGEGRDRDEAFPVGHA